VRTTITEGSAMRVESRDDQVAVWMTRAEADELQREIDKWPELPRVERDLVNALKRRNP
jgi:hypothetical protein